MKRIMILAGVGLIAALTLVGRFAWRAHKDIVTLEANDLPVRDVIKKLRWLTWEDIEVHKEVEGRVTLNVEDQPLPVVLAIIGEQVSCRWSVAYPLYTTKDKLKLALKVASGEVRDPQPGWTNWNARPNFAAMAARLRETANRDANGSTNEAGGVGRLPGSFGGPWDQPANDSLVTVDFKDASPLEAAAELRRYGSVKVVPQDGTGTKVNLTLKDAEMDDAVAALAKSVYRKWAKFYALEPRRRPRPTEQEREQFANIPRPDPEQMRQRMEQMAENPAVQARMESRMRANLLNSTPEQRVERDKERQRRRQQRGGGR